jgi:hypothetical protein
VARRRYITSDISLNKQLPTAAEVAGFGAPFCYLMLIPQLDDWARTDGDAEKIKWNVFQRYPMITESVIEEWLGVLSECRLIEWYELKGQKVIQYNQEAFWRIQTYITKDKQQSDKSKHPPLSSDCTKLHRREFCANNSNFAIPNNFAPSPSPSPSPSPKDKEQSPSKLSLPLEANTVALYETLPEPPTGCIRNSDSWGRLLRRIEHYKSATAQHHRKGTILRENEKLALVAARDACCKAIAEKWPGCTLVGKCTEYINNKVSQVIAKNTDQPLDNPAYYFVAMFQNLPNDDDTAEKVGRPVKEMRNGRVLR